MRIHAIRHAVPSRRITNEDVVQHVRERNADRWGPRLPALEERLRASFAAAGTEVRYALADDETALEIAARAGRDALAAGGMEPGDIEFLIYAGVGRGWLEPATSGAVQTALGLGAATSFDVMEACASWLRALQVAHAYIRSGVYRRGMIVNAECGLYRAYCDWKIESLEELDYRLATYTIGEAATATVVTDEVPEDDFHFTFKTLGQHLDLCMIPLPNVADFHPGTPTGVHAPGRFFARSRELFEVAIGGIVETFERDTELRKRTHDVAFGHEATARVSEIVTRALGVLPIYFPIHREYGNTVSSSVPLAMSLALDAGRLAPGKRVLVIIGSAGMSIGLASFTY